MNKKILIVDDTPANIKVLAGALADFNYELLMINTGERALAVAERVIPDLILLDINLPGLNGFEVCEKLKSNPLTAGIPVIFLSALDDPQSKVTGFSVGGVDYITKPFFKEEVCSRVQTHLKIAELAQDLEHQNQELFDAMEELRTVQSELEQTNELLIESIVYSRRIQNAILPSESMLKSIFPQSFVIYKPKNLVSGDFYWCNQYGADVIIVGADCTGHGVPGAFMSLIGITILSLLLEFKGILNPADILNNLDKKVQKLLGHQENVTDHINDGMDIAVCHYNKETKELYYSSAYRPICLVREGQLLKLENDRASIGRKTFPHNGYNLHHLHLKKDDAIYLYTDGITDQFGGPDNRKFQPRRFYNLLLSTQSLNMDEQSKNILAEIEAWKNNDSQTDDIMVMGIKITD